MLFNGNLRKLVPDRAMAECLATLIELNRAAAETLSGFEVHAATDVTGFGLAGHAFEVASASDIVLAVEIDLVPTLASALDMYERGVTDRRQRGQWRARMGARTLRARAPGLAP